MCVCVRMPIYSCVDDTIVVRTFWLVQLQRHNGSNINIQTDPRDIGDARCYLTLQGALDKFAGRRDIVRKDVDGFGSVAFSGLCLALRKIHGGSKSQAAAA